MMSLFQVSYNVASLNDLSFALRDIGNHNAVATFVFGFLHLHQELILSQIDELLLRVGPLEGEAIPLKECFAILDRNRHRSAQAIHAPVKGNPTSFHWLMVLFQVQA
jgi:hypothetical protein